MVKRYCDDPKLEHIKSKEYVVWDDSTRKYRVDLSGKGINPDPDGKYSYTHRGSNKTWANSKEKGRSTLMKKILKDALTELYQYGGKSELSAELEQHMKFKPAPWIQNGEDGTCYVNLEDGSLVPTKSADNVASKDEIKKWEEASLEEKRVIVDDVLKTLKIRRLNRECTRKGREEKRNKNTTKKKSTKATSNDDEIDGTALVNMPEDDFMEYVNSRKVREAKEVIEKRSQPKRQNKSKQQSEEEEEEKPKGRAVVKGAKSGCKKFAEPEKTGEKTQRRNGGRKKKSGRANHKQPQTEDSDDDAGLNRHPQNSKQLPSQAVQEEDVPSEITLNENDPLLIFLRSQESCIKGCVGEFYTWLVTSEDIDSMAALKEAVNEDEYLDIIKVGGGGSSVKGYKVLSFKRDVLAYDNTKAPVAAVDSTDAKIAELGDKVDNNEEAVVKLEDKVDKENSHQYKFNGLLLENMKEQAENMKKDREQADEKHAASMKTSELLQEEIVTVQKEIVTVNNKVDKNKEEQDNWNEKQDAKVNKMKKKQNQLVKSVRKTERKMKKMERALRSSPLGKKAREVKKRLSLSFKPKSRDDSEDASSASAQSDNGEETNSDANDSDASIASDTSSVSAQSENGEESDDNDSDDSIASDKAVNVEKFDAKEKAASPKTPATKSDASFVPTKNSQRDEEEAKFNMRPLTDEELQEAASALYGIGPVAKILVRQGNDSVQRGSMQSLRPKACLNDEIVNHFLKNCLAKRDEKLCATQPGRKPSLFCHSFFVQAMFDAKNSNPSLRKYGHKNVKKFYKKVDIFNLRYIVCPINIDNMHWTSAIIFMESKKIQYFDSIDRSKVGRLLGVSLNQYLKDEQTKLEGLLQYLKDEHKAKKGKELDVSEWKLVPCTSDTPRQGNNFDCGVFTCMNCDFVSRDCPLVFTQNDIYKYKCRERIALSIMKNCAIE